MVAQISSAGLKQRSLQLRHTSRRWSSKILQRMKSSHCMLNQTQSNCETSQAKETPEHYLLEKDREVLFKIIKKKYKKKRKNPANTSSP